jgi:uncharacterized membrane protein YfhO
MFSGIQSQTKTSWELVCCPTSSSFVLATTWWRVSSLLPMAPVNNRRLSLSWTNAQPTTFSWPADQKEELGPSASEGVLLQQRMVSFVFVFVCLFVLLFFVCLYFVLLFFVFVCIYLFSCVFFFWQNWKFRFFGYGHPEFWGKPEVPFFSSTDILAKPNFLFSCC